MDFIVNRFIGKTVMSPVMWLGNILINHGQTNNWFFINILFDTMFINSDFGEYLRYAWICFYSSHCVFSVFLFRFRQTQRIRQLMIGVVLLHECYNAQRYKVNYYLFRCFTARIFQIRLAQQVF